MVDEAVLHGRLSAHEVVAIAVDLDPLDGLTGVFGQNAVDSFPRLQDLAGVDINIGRLALKAGRALVMATSAAASPSESKRSVWPSEQRGPAMISFS